MLSDMAEVGVSKCSGCPTFMYVCVLNWTIQHKVNLNVTWIGFVFDLILFAQMHGAVDVL